MTDATKTLIVGATGNIGRHVVTGLAARGVAVRALTRTPAAAGLPDGVDVVTGDLTDPESLAGALAGVDAVFLLWPFPTADGAGPVVDAIARHARRVVYVSAINVSDDRPPAENGVWGQVEDLIRRSGLAWTFLRASGFATNTLSWAREVRAGRPVRIPYPRAARSVIHERDIAAVAVRALTEEGHAGRAYVLTGPASITQAEQVRTLGRVAGRPVRIEEMPPEEARAGILAWADPGFADRALAFWASLVDSPEPVTRTVEEITGSPARSFEQWAHDHVDDLRPPSTARVAERYVSSMRAGRMDQAVRLMAPDLVRVAPLEGGAGELRGLPTVLAHGRRLTSDFQIHSMRVEGPYLDDGNRFAVRFAFDWTYRPSGERRTSTKMSLYTVAAGAIIREEVYYFDAPPDAAAWR